MTLAHRVTDMDGISYRLSILAGVVLFLCCSVAVAQTVNDSLHDLGASGLAQGTVPSAGVCVFCHTPHGSDIAAPVPLWNKVMPATGGYQMYSTLNTPSLDGAEQLLSSSPSLACLSCHDGGQAMDVVLNAPGSGRYNAAGIQIGDGVQVVAMTGTPIPTLGTDLRDDHPISIQYAGGGCSDLVTGCTTLGDLDFTTPQYASINSNDVWWVDSIGGTATVKEKTDMLLYTRLATVNVAGGGAVEPFVECGSCHDPHNAATAVVDVSPAFMRVQNLDSVVCRSCHLK